MSDHDIKLTPVKSYYARAIHRGCGGELKYAGVNKPVAPPIYVHKCETCQGFVDIRAATYPAIQQQIVGDDGLTAFERALDG